MIGPGLQLPSRGQLFLSLQLQVLLVSVFVVCCGSSITTFGDVSSEAFCSIFALCA